MGKFTGDPLRIIAKSEVGRLQLEDAIRLFLEKRYLSAITLAGAADAIFSGLIEASGGTTPADAEWAQIEYVRSLELPLGGKITKKEAFKRWNDARNRLKHHDREKDEFFLEIFDIDESYHWIERARHSAKMIGIEPRNIIEFDNCVIPWFFLEKGD